MTERRTRAGNVGLQQHREADRPGAAQWPTAPSGMRTASGGLRSLPPAHTLHRSLIDAWNSLGVKRNLSKGELLFLQGDPAALVFLVIKGRIDIVHLSNRGRKFVSYEAMQGDIVGEMALLPDAIYSCSAEAAVDSAVLLLRGQTVSNLIAERGDFASEFAVNLARRLDRLERRAKLLALCTVEARVAGLLVEEARCLGDVLRLTHREIGERAGMARESVTLALNQLKRLGALDLSRGRIRVQSPGVLATNSGVTANWQNSPEPTKPAPPATRASSSR